MPYGQVKAATTEPPPSRRQDNAICDPVALFGTNLGGRKQLNADDDPKILAKESVMKMTRLALFSLLVLYQGVCVALAEGDVAHGEAVYELRCGGCHDVTEVATLTENHHKKPGPSLHQLIGRPAGTLPGFAFSPAMMSSAIVWNRETLRPYLFSPKTMIPKNRMMFNGVQRDGEMEDLLDYLYIATQ